MLSVNQINAQIKITEVWKAIHDPSHPLKIEKVNHDSQLCVTRSVTQGDLKEFGKTDMVQSSFLSDASKAWNACPIEIKTVHPYGRQKSPSGSLSKRYQSEASPNLYL